MSAWLERQQARTIKPAADVPAEDVTHQRISLYKDSPSGEVCIEEFERFAIDRLRGECVHDSDWRNINERGQLHRARCPTFHDGVANHKCAASTDLGSKIVSQMRSRLLRETQDNQHVV